jgi:hypothetical protein
MMNISEFERGKPTETLKQINLLIEMQKCTDKKIGGCSAGAEIRRSFVDPKTEDDGWDWYIFKDELEKLKKLFIEGK